MSDYYIKKLFDVAYLTRQDWDRYEDKHDDSKWEGEGYYNIGTVEGDSVDCYERLDVIIPLEKHIKDVKDLLGLYRQELKEVEHRYVTYKEQTRKLEELKQLEEKVTKLKLELGKS